MALTPDWPLDYVPLVSEWSYWFSSKLDEHPVIRVSPGDASVVISGTGLGILILDPAASLFSLTVELPQGPVDLQRFRVVSTQFVEAVTVSSGDATTVSGGGPWALSAHGGMEWIYVALYATWYKIL